MSQGWPAPPAPFGRYYPDAHDPQAPAAVAVVMPTILRPEIVRAVESVFRQTLAARIQLMIGVDRAAHPPAALEAALAARPANLSALVLELPYSTSVRHGGVHTALDGGALRTLLSFLANARHVAFLDDDNQYEPDHLESLLSAIQGKPWAHSLRLLVREDTGEALAVDRWDSVGVGRGRFAAQGGFVDTNCLLVDKVAAARALGRWAESGTGKPGLTADRNFFAALKDAPHGRVDRPTVRYGIRPTNVLNNFIRNDTRF
jgi:hypothetical protein